MSLINRISIYKKLDELKREITNGLCNEKVAEYFILKDKLESARA